MKFINRSNELKLLEEEYKNIILIELEHIKKATRIC